MMNWLEVKLTTSQNAVECIANIFHEIKAGGVVIEDPQLIAFYAKKGAWDDHDFTDEFMNDENVIVKGYLPLDQFLANKIENLRIEIDLLKSRIPNLLVKTEMNMVNEEDWANAWKAYFKPERIGEKIVIKPSWEEYIPENGDLVVELDPGMAFGTGGHQSTSLCIRLLEKYLKEDMEVMDVGTGSGILSIVAAKLGAKHIQGFDFDTVAVQVANDNVTNNKLEDRISIKYSDLFAEAQGKVDLIVANIVADIIIKLIPKATEFLKGERLFMASGIIDDRKEDVLRSFGEYGYNIKEVLEDSGWVAIVASGPR